MAHSLWVYVMFCIELIEISDDSCDLKAGKHILKEVNKQNRMSNTSFVDQDKGLHWKRSVLKGWACIYLRQDSQSKHQLDFIESVQGRLHEYVHAKIQASDHAEGIYKPFRDTSRVLNISIFLFSVKLLMLKWDDPIRRELIENRLRRQLNEEYSEWNYWE